MMSDPASDLILSLSEENTRVFNENVKLKEEIEELKKQLKEYRG
jgi:cell division septum initiation protein DivIVA